MRKRIREGKGKGGAGDRVGEERQGVRRWDYKGERRGMVEGGDGERGRGKESGREG
jgi:hypothetical protein